MKHLIGLARHVGFRRAIWLTITDKWRKAVEWSRRTQPIRSAWSTCDHKRRHRTLRILFDYSNEKEGGLPAWEYGLSSPGLENKAKLYDGEGQLQLTVLEVDGCVDRVPWVGTGWIHYVINKKGVSYLRTGHYLREGSTEMVPRVSTAIAGIAIVISVWQSVTVSEQSRRIDDLNREVGQLRTERAVSTEAPSRQVHQTPPPMSGIEVLCGPCDSIPVKERAEKKKKKK